MQRYRLKIIRILFRIGNIEKDIYVKVKVMHKCPFIVSIMIALK